MNARWLPLVLASALACGSSVSDADVDVEPTTGGSTTGSASAADPSAESGSTSASGETESTSDDPASTGASSTGGMPCADHERPLEEEPTRGMVITMLIDGRLPPAEIDGLLGELAVMATPEGIGPDNRLLVVSPQPCPECVEVPEFGFVQYDAELLDEGLLPILGQLEPDIDWIFAGAAFMGKHVVVFTDEEPVVGPEEQGYLGKRLDAAIVSVVYGNERGGCPPVPGYAAWLEETYGQALSWCDDDLADVIATASVRPPGCVWNLSERDQPGPWDPSQEEQLVFEFESKEALELDRVAPGLCHLYPLGFLYGPTGVGLCPIACRELNRDTITDAALRFECP